METTKIKAIEAVYDWNIWPRHSITHGMDTTNIARMKEALRAGFPLPPAVLSRKDYRIVDGFHRIQAYLKVCGEDAEIEVYLKDYSSDADMVLDSGALNSLQGLPLSPKDKAHFIIKCRRMKLPFETIATALHMDSEKIKIFLKKRSAQTEVGEKIPLPAGARNLAGKTLTPVQEHFARTANGCLPEMYARMLLNALRADALTLTDKTMDVLRQLRDELNLIVEEAA